VGHNDGEVAALLVGVLRRDLVRVTTELLRFLRLRGM
jgi:hypothetical protein